MDAVYPSNDSLSLPNFLYKVIGLCVVAWPGPVTSNEGKGIGYSGAMSGKNRRLVADEPVEFEKQPVEVHRDLRKFTHHFRGIYRIYLE